MMYRKKRQYRGAYIDFFPKVNSIVDRIKIGISRGEASLEGK